ncbi:GTPase-activating protein [Onthophagus taurus]|uniref:GTPase-activating protein n=1 Tax=Onthophagus taurus TaxID=166361 RepID=UPI000C209E17|nr:GTPase-activating protein [Onthophagus taurus]
MADDNLQVRTEERLKIKIGAAKNLQCRSHTSVQRDVYCTVSLDQEEIFRTSTIEKTLSPFFSEEFQFNVPRKFRYLSVYLYDRDRHLKQDKVLGKVAIKREDLAQYNNKDHWFSIQPVDADSEVQGKANIKIDFENVSNKNQTSICFKNRLVVRVVECTDLTLKNGSCDPFALVTVVYSNGKKVNKRTKTKKKTASPVFNEEFYFDSVEEKDNKGYIEANEPDVEICELHVSFWHDAPGMAGDVFLGEVKVSLRGPQQQKGAHNNAWYFLQPRSGKNKPNSCSTPPGTRLSGENMLGSLRLQIQYTADHVLPLEKYARLCTLLLNSIHTQPITNSPVYILGDIVSNKADIAQPLVRIFLHHQQIVDIIRALAIAEISTLTDPTTIFRGNTLVSKMMDEAMKLCGIQYLHKTLRPTIDQIFNEKKPCEIDPTKVKDPNTIQANLANLTTYVQRIFEAITQSAVGCPSLMCQIFINLKECAMKHFPQNREVRYSVISGFIFLRFFAPAILGPRLFDLTSEQIDSQTNRTLTLISKTIQSLGNSVSCRSAQQLCKEDYMDQLYKKFCTEERVAAVRKFLDIISTNTSQNVIPIDTPVTLKEGIMTKRAQGRRRFGGFGRKNFKRRYFKLTTHDLSYSKTRGKEALCQIPLSNILAVERLHEQSFQMKNMFQIVQRERALYVQAANCVEEKEWVDLLTKICQTNKNRLTKYHPCAFIDGHWLCCQSTIASAAGCHEVSSVDSNNLHMTLDPARELQRMHSLIIAHMQEIDRKMSEKPTNTIVCNNLDQLRNEVWDIEQTHRRYQRNLARETKYGSKQAPIGDDNYLLLRRAMT